MVSNLLVTMMLAKLTLGLVTPIFGLEWNRTSKNTLIHVWNVRLEQNLIPNPCHCNHCLFYISPTSISMWICLGLSKLLNTQTNLFYALQMHLQSTLKLFPFLINKLSQWTMKFLFIGFTDLVPPWKCILMGVRNFATKCLMTFTLCWVLSTKKRHRRTLNAMHRWRFSTKLWLNIWHLLLVNPFWIESNLSQLWCFHTTLAITPHLWQLLFSCYLVWNLALPLFHRMFKDNTMGNLLLLKDCKFCNKLDKSHNNTQKKRGIF